MRGKTVGNYETLNELLVTLFRDVMDIEQKVIITPEFKDITNNDMHVIEAIGIGEPKNMSSIARELSVTVGTLTIAMNSLVKKGYVERSRGLEDRRVVYISLSERGRKAYGHHARFHREMIESLTSDLSEDGVKGCRRFLDRVWKLQDLMTDEEGYSKDLEIKMHQTIKKVSNDFENLKYNTAIAAMMTLLNDFYKKGSITRGELKTLIILLNPVAPHITEEMWQIIGCEGRVYQQTWPEFDEAKTVESSVEIAVQINGKVKGTLGIQKDDPKDQVIAKAKEVIADKLTGNIIKEIYVPGRLVNIVMK